MDEIKKYLACEGRVNIVCAETTDLVEKARKTHDLSPIATAGLGRLLTMGAIMGTTLKDENETITLQIKGGGPIGKLTCVVNEKVEVKGYVDEPIVDLPLKENGKLDVGKAVGKEGFLYVIKDIGLKEPYVGITPLVSGEIAEDFAKYFAESEQVPSIVALGVLVDKNGVKKAGGYFVSLMPDATEEDISQIEKAFEKAEPVSTMLEKEMSLQQIAETITGDNNLMVLDRKIYPSFKCDCNRDRFRKKIKLLSKKEIEELFEKQSEIEVVCQFCNKKYNFSKDEIITE